VLEVKENERDQVMQMILCYIPNEQCVHIYKAHVSGYKCERERGEKDTLGIIPN
jgi:hypothetical protein